MKLYEKKQLQLHTHAAVLNVQGRGGVIGVTAGSAAVGCGNSQVSRRSPGFARISQTFHFSSRCPTITDMHCLPLALRACPLRTPVFTSV